MKDLICIVFCKSYAPAHELEKNEKMEGFIGMMAGLDGLSRKIHSALQ